MPTVPRAQRQVRREGLPNVRLTAAETEASAGVGVELAKAQTAGAMAGFGNTLTNVAGGLYAAEVQKERDRADSVAILSAERQLAEWENKRLFDPDTGALNTRGKDALGLPEQLQGEYAELTGAVEKTLSTDRQREMFERLKVNRGMGLDLTIRRHVAGEMNRYEAQELESGVANFVSSAIAHANDPERIGTELDRAIGALKEHGPRLGMGPEVLDRRVRDVTSATHAGVIERLLATDQDKAAKVYFEETRGQISGESIAKIEKALEEGTLRGESQRQGDVIVAAGGTLTEQRAKVKAIEDPKLRDQVLQRVEHEAAVQEREENEREREVLTDAYNRVDKSGGDIRAIPTAVWSGLSGNARSALRSYSEHIAQGIPVKTNDAVFYNLMTRAGDSPESFVKENLLTYKAKLSSSDFQQLAGLQLSIKNGIASGANSAAQKPLDDFRTRKEILDDSLVLYGIDPSAKPDTDEGKQIAQLRRLLDTTIANQVGGEHGKKISNSDIQEHVDALMISRVSKKGSWWNILPGGEPFNDVTKRFIDYTIGDVPAKDRQEITDSLKRRSRVVTDQSIVDTFILGQLAAQKRKAP